MIFGSGPPVVLIPGVQGRWEWMRPAVDALAQRCRVITYSLAGDPLSDCAMEMERGFDVFLDQLDRVLDDAGVERATLCGVSYGGLIALRYAARRPSRVSALVLVSTPAPGWEPQSWIERYARWPRLSAPLFIVRSPGRIWPEIRASRDTLLSSARVGATHLINVARAPFSASLMGARVRLLLNGDFTDDAARVCVPTLVVTGEPGLDRVVPVEVTRRYTTLIPDARAATIERTGHIGLITRSDRFAEIVCGFAEATGAA
jgi:3-oxoadipate enol-lactonase